MIIKQYDVILLKDGRTGTVVEVLGNGKAFLVDIGSSPDDWDNVYVEYDEIEKILYEYKNK